MLAPKAPTIVDGTWINVPPVSDALWRGRGVLLLFWATSSEQSIHRLRQLEDERRRLDAGLDGDDVLLLAVHSPRFDFERDEQHVRAEVARLGVSIPVVHDAELATAGLYQPDGWPTVVLVDHWQRAVGMSSGRDETELRDMVDQLRDGAHHSGRKRRDDPFPRPSRSEEHDETRPITGADTCFPTGVARLGHQLLVADRDRVRAFRLSDDAQSAHAIAPPGFVPGASRVVWLDHENFAVSQPDHRQIHITALDRLHLPPTSAPRRPGQLPSGRSIRRGLERPVGMTVDLDGSLVIADAGADRLFRLAEDPDAEDSLRLGPIAGSGWSGCTDGANRKATLSEPSAVTRVNRGVLFADSGSNSLRLATDKGRVMTVAAGGVRTGELPEPGLIDGRAHRARMQRPTATATLADGSVVIADSGNHRLRLLHRRKLRTMPVAGLRYPLDVSCDPTCDDDLLFVADTHHHRIVVVDPKTERTWPLTLLD